MHASYNTDLPNCFEYLRSIGLGPHTNHHSKLVNIVWRLIKTANKGLSAVGGYRQGRTPWMHPTLYPVEKTLFEGADTSSDATLVVDVAGGLGHDINEFKKLYPNHPGVSCASVYFPHYLS